MKSRSYLIFFLYFVPDLLAILLAMTASALFALSHYVIPGSTYSLLEVYPEYMYVLACIVWYYSSKSTGLYENPISKEISQDIANILTNVFVQIICLIIALFVFKVHALTRTFVLVYACLLVSTLIVEKYVVRRLVGLLKARTGTLGNVLIVGDGPIVDEVRENLVNSSIGYNVVGIFGEASGNESPGDFRRGIGELEHMLDEKGVDIVIITARDKNREVVDAIITACQNHFVTVKIVPELIEHYARHLSFSFAGNIPLIAVTVDRLAETHWKIVKRSFDVVLTLVLSAAVLWWLVPLLVVLQKIFDRGPVFYRAERSGAGGEHFMMHKFRTMKTASVPADALNKPTTKGDDRITKFGRLMRKTSLDELPQFFNVLKGEMSLVGPRPLDIGESHILQGHIGNYVVRQYVKPGITGWAQVNG